MTLEPPNLDLYLALLGDTLLDPGLQAPDPQRIGPDAQSLIPVPDFQRASDGSAQGRSGSGELSDKRTGSGRAPPIHSSFTAPSAEGRGQLSHSRRPAGALNPWPQGPRTWPQGPLATVVPLGARTRVVALCAPAPLQTQAHAASDR